MNLVAKFDGKHYYGDDVLKITSQIRSQAASDESWWKERQHQFIHIPGAIIKPEPFDELRIQWFELQPLTVIINTVVEIYRK